MDEIELLRDFRSIVAPETTAAKIQARAMLHEQMRPQPRDQRRHWLVRGGVSAALGALVLTAIVAFNPLAGPRSSNSAAAAELQAMASTAAQQTTLSAPLAVGEYIYTRTDSTWGSTADTGDGEGSTALIPRITEIWIGADGSGRVREAVTGDLIWLTEPNDEMAELFLRGAATNQTFGPGELYDVAGSYGLTPDVMAELAANPDALATMVRERAAQTDNPLDYESFVIAGDLLRTSTLPAEFRAAVYRFAADIPHVELIGDGTDSIGRTGVVVAMEHEGIRHELVFDPGTTDLLEERDIVVSSDAVYTVDIGTIVARSTTLDAGIVSSTDATPAP